MTSYNDVMPTYFPFSVMCDFPFAMLQSIMQSIQKGFICHAEGCPEYKQQFYIYIQFCNDSFITDCHVDIHSDIDCFSAVFERFLLRGNFF